MKHSVCMLAALMLLASCAPKNDQLDVSEAGLSGKTVRVVVGPTPDFSLMTGGTAASWGLLFGPFASIASGPSAASNGAELVRESAIADPTVQLAQDLSVRLQQRYGAVLATPQPALLQTDDAELINRMYGDKDYLLQVRNLGWGTMYELAGSLGHMITLQAELRDNASGKVVAQATCSDTSPKEYGLDELRDNHAALLKKLLDGSREKCLAEFARVLGVATL